MADFSGSALVVTWTYGAGTNVLTGDQRTFSYTPSIDYIDVTAGADANKKYITGVKDGQASFEALLQGGTILTGTVAYANLAEGYSGTIKWQPEGTASTKPYFSMPALCGGCNYSYPYADVVTVSIPFQQNGARTEGTNT
jgi:hypothetical protein